ncbi:MAG: aminotransferase class I/II-fold pyridoxal phosphate-dependent enzyme [Alphaproteobacteria bacterium]|nr:aminotransferase class I/II-fold pyridoxal phosphate-dependent enzyme [Alphaproteobacteria bacterium]
MRDFALERYFSTWEFAARYHMTASDMESLSLPDLLAMASPEDREAFETQWLGYSETFGLAELRATIAATYDTATADDILCFAGAEEGVYTAMRVLLDADSHAIVAVPNYQAAETVPLDICAVTGVPLDADDGWSLDIDRVAQAIRPNTKVVSINFPNNPTGAILDRERFDALVELCRTHGLYLFSDEVYRLVERDPALRLPQAADVYERGLSLHVMSKVYGLPGLRIGWIMTKDSGVRQRMERYKHYLSICNSGPSEWLALIALKARDRILARNRALVDANAAKLDAFFGEYPDLFEWRRSDGGCVGYPRYLGAGSADEFCEDLVDRAGILLLPPKVYRSELIDTPQDRFRIGFGRAGIDEGLAAFRAYLNSNRKS